MTTLLDTRTVTPSERSDYWSAGITEHFFPVRVESVGSRPFDARLSGGRVGAIDVCAIKGVQHAVRRTSRQIDERDPGALLLYLLRRGSARIEQGDQTCVLAPGELAVQDTSRPSAFETIDEVDVAVFSIPKWLLGPRATMLGRRTAVRVSGGRGTARLSTPFLAQLARTVEGQGPAPSPAEAEGLSDMLLGTLWALYGYVESSTARNRGDALLDRMRRHILEHLQDPGLGPDEIADAHFVSTRYVHKLFAATGCGVSAWIREQRLERASTELQQSPEASIASVAARWGYRDPASFSRAFRHAFGCSPREHRRSV